MEEELELVLESTKDDMDRAIVHMEKSLLKIRAGRASPSMLDSVMVEYYGSPTPLAQVSNVNTPDARTISIQPWEKNIIPDIERSIINAGLGFNPMNNGESVIISVPPLTEERRRDLAKMAKAESENAKVGVRAARKSAMDELKRMGNDGLSEDLRKDNENNIQKMTDDYITKCDTMFAKKENDIMTV
ncbi:MAG: ribosome recycling factor [Flavobacteriales bacterium]|jgi:ribosome recycling factor|nr:ribosome recycling factor [Flavobacteriales bacterium]|tara:strand:+ start:522 stop:1085 length:564 start_codon:yes stop_codon:yes gene_type:complete